MEEIEGTLKIVNDLNNCLPIGRTGRKRVNIMNEVERCIKKKYPNCVIVYEYCDGEILFYENKEQSGNEENLHSGYMERGKFIDTIDL